MRFLGVAFSESDDNITANGHSFELFLFLVGVWVVVIIESYFRILDVCFEVQESLAVDFIIQNCVPGCALFHEFGVDTSLVCCFPVL